MVAMAAILDLDQTLLVIFDLQVALIIPTKFQVNWPFGQEKIIKTDFQDGSHGSQFGFQIRTILAIFYLQVAPIFPTKFWSTGI